MKFFEKKLKSETLYSGKVVTLEVDEVLLPNGKKGIRECESIAAALPYF